ncbi:MAG: class E sortase [Acidimicrobiia bacterium]
MDLRRVIRGAGKFFISVGVLLFLFVGYQLWGTGIAEARGQRELAASFERRGQLTTVPTIPPPGATAEAAPPSTLPPLQLGDALAQIEIPKIDVKKWVIEGVEVEDLKAGPGHYPGTPLPGQRGNSAIAGHRTTYGAPFYDLDKLAVGDSIFVTTAEGRFQYDVTESKIVDPSAVEVLDPTEDNRLTLTTCHPKFSAAERLIIVARLMSDPTDTEPPPPAARPPSLEGTREISAGLSGGRANKTPAILWGSLAAAIWLGAWLLGRFWRRWPAYAIGILPFLLVLYVFFENVARLLPANV